MPRTARPVKLRVMNGRGPGKDGKARDSGGRPIEMPPPFKRLPPEKPKKWKVANPAVASAHWDAIVPELQRLELLKPDDIGGLITMCEIWAIRQQALEELIEDGLTIETPQGKLRHPAVGIVATCWKEYRSWAAHFGLTPASEGRLAKPKEPSDDEENPFA